MLRMLFFLLLPILIIADNNRGLYLKTFGNENKVALVIGNNSYKNFTELRNPVNDANSIKKILISKGFKVFYLENATLKEMEKTIRKFTHELKNGGVGMVYYAGHGIEVDGYNYLIPVDAEIIDKNEIKYESLPINMLIDKMVDSNNRLNILILDACRNDPFSRGGSGGLAAINNAKGMYIAYATAPGEVASDGTEKNGLFTKHLLNEISKKQKLEEVFKNTRTNVYNESNGKQLPWTSSSVMGEFYFTINEPNVKEKINEKEEIQKNTFYTFENKIIDKYSLKIDTYPEASKVILKDSKYIYNKGIKLPKGKYTIEISKKGYISKIGNIDLNSDLQITVSLEKEKNKENLDLSLNDKQKEGIIFLGDRFTNHKLENKKCSKLLSSAIKSFISNQKEYSISYTPCHKNFPDLAKLNTNVNDYFKKESFFSAYTPDLIKLNEICHTTKEKFVILANGEVSKNMIFNYELYLYDCKTARIKSKNFFAPIVSFEITAEKQILKLFSDN